MEEMLVGGMKERLGRLLESVPDEKLDELMEKTASFAAHLRSKYQDAGAYRSYHALAGSSIDEDIVSIKEDDFPGEDSVEAFIQELEKEYRA